MFPITCRNDTRQDTHILAVEQWRIYDFHNGEPARRPGIEVPHWDPGAKLRSESGTYCSP